MTAVKTRIYTLVRVNKAVFYETYTLFNDQSIYHGPYLNLFPAIWEYQDVNI